MPLRTMRMALALLAAAASWQVAGAVMAQTSVDEIVVNGASTEGQDIRHQIVRYGDLNLRQETGARALLGRIQAAAKNVCEPEPANVDLTGQTQYKSCLSHAVSGAVYRVGSDRLSDLYAHAPTAVAAR